MTPEEIAAWDAEIEAEFQRMIVEPAEAAAGATAKARRRALRDPHMGAPVSFWKTVRERVKGAGAQTLALYVYRRTMIARQRTVTLTSADLAELRISQSAVYRGLTALKTVGLISIDDRRRGRRPRVTLLWDG
jgi:hypothetical protein